MLRANVWEMSCYRCLFGAELKVSPLSDLPERFLSSCQGSPSGSCCLNWKPALQPCCPTSAGRGLRSPPRSWALGALSFQSITCIMLLLPVQLAGTTLSTSLLLPTSTHSTTLGCREICNAFSYGLGKPVCVWISWAD